MAPTQIREGSGILKSERLDARVSPAQKALIQRAALLSGRTVSDFMVATLQEAAERVVRSHDVMTLSVQASEALARAFLAPPEPNEALVAAYRRYHEQVHDE
jgi:uncharacterized protein (DUF1778 family)